MAPLNAVLDSNKNRVNDFMERLTDVTDLDKHLNVFLFFFFSFFLFFFFSFFLFFFFSFHLFTPLL